METGKRFSEEDKLRIINESITDVVPDKMIHSVNFETSITEDLALDSIEIMDVLLKLREKFTMDDKMIEGIDIDRLLNYLFKTGYGDITVRSLSNFIDEIA